MWRKALVAIAIAFWAWGMEGLSSGVQLFAWDLADWGPENLVLRFEPRVETTLAAYNTAMAHAKYGIVGLKCGEFVLNMAGFKELTPAELSRYKTETEAIIGAQNGILTLNGIVLWEWMSHSIGLDFQRLHDLLLSLAEAIDAEDFEHVYNTLLPQGLEKLVEYFLEHHFYYQLLSPEEQALEREKVKELIRLLALKYREVYLAHFGEELGPSGITGAVVNALKPHLWKLVEGFLISYMMDRLQPDPVLEYLDQAVRIVSETLEVIIELRVDISEIVLSLTFDEASAWLVDYVDRTPSLPPSLFGRKYSGILNEISLDCRMMAGKTGKDYTVLIAPVIALLQSYYEVWYFDLNSDDKAFKDEAEQLLRTLELLWAAGSDYWVLQGFFFDKTAPGKGVNLLISRLTEVERSPAPPGEDLYLKGHRSMDLALVRYEHTADPELDTEEIVSWINEGVELVHRWAEEETSAGTGFDVGDPRGAKVVHVSREIVAVIFEAEITRDEALEIAKEVWLMDDELVLIMWKEGRGDLTVTHAVAVESHAHDFDTGEITEIGESLTPWREDEFIVEEEVKAESVVISGGNCSWEGKIILPMIDT